MGEIHLFWRIKIQTPFSPDSRMINDRARRISTSMGNSGNHESLRCPLLSFKVLKGEKQWLMKQLLTHAACFMSCTGWLKWVNQIQESGLLCSYLWKVFWAFLLENARELILILQYFPDFLVFAELLGKLVEDSFSFSKWCCQCR